MFNTKLPSSRITSCKHSRRRYLQRLPSWTTSDPESRYLDMYSLLSTSRIKTRREQRSYWHLVTLTVLCVITVLAFIMYTLKSYTHRIITRCMTRQNTSSQNTEPTPFHETSCTSCDENAPDSTSDERHVVFSVYPNLSP